MSDEEKQLNKRSKQLEKKLEQKQQEIKEAEDYLRKKKRVLEEAKATLEENKAELRERIETRSKVNYYGGIANVIVGIFSPILGLAAAAVNYAVDENVLRKNVEDQREITKSCADEVSSCKSRVKIAENGKKATLKELHLINDKLNDTDNKLEQCQEKQKYLKNCKRTLLTLTNVLKGVSIC